MRIQQGLSAGALWLVLVACEHAPPPTPVSSDPPVSVPRDAMKATVPGDAPGKVTITVSDECGFILDQVYFEPGSASLRDTQRPVLDAAAEMFRCFLRTGEVTRWQVIGNTDATERESATLSLARARTVAGALVARGVFATTLEVTGAGATQPLDRRRTAEARAKNRRVFFLVLQRRRSSP